MLGAFQLCLYMWLVSCSDKTFFLLSHPHNIHQQVNQLQHLIHRTVWMVTAKSYMNVPPLNYNTNRKIMV
jgi:hypothetical protein